MAGEVEPFEYRESAVVTKGGEEKIIAWHNIILKDDKGTIIGSLSSGEDITERKRAEEALRESEEKLNTLFGAMTEMVVLHELVLNESGEAVDYRITDCNTAFTAVTGIKKEDALGKLATEVYQTTSLLLKAFYLYNLNLLPIRKPFLRCREQSVVLPVCAYYMTSS